MDRRAEVRALSQNGERTDDLLNGYFILQDPQTFCFGIDAVLLAHFPEIRRNDRILDLGCGNGVIPLLAAAEAEKMFGADSGVRSTGLEIQAAEASRAERSVQGNGLSDRIRILQGDMRRIREIFPGNSFSLVYANPPYMPAGSGAENANEALRMARHEVTVHLPEVIAAAGYALRDHGRFAMIHRPERLPEIFTYLAQSGLAPRRMRPVCPKEGKDANLVLLLSVKGAKPSLTLEKALTVYGPDGKYTEEILRIYGNETTART